MDRNTFDMKCQSIAKTFEEIAPVLISDLKNSLFSKEENVEEYKKTLLKIQHIKELVNTLYPLNK